MCNQARTIEATKFLFLSSSISSRISFLGMSVSYTEKCNFIHDGFFMLNKYVYITTFCKFYRNTRENFVSDG